MGQFLSLHNISLSTTYTCSDPQYWIQNDHCKCSIHVHLFQFLAWQKKSSLAMPIQTQVSYIIFFCQEYKSISTQQQKNNLAQRSKYNWMGKKINFIFLFFNRMRILRLIMATRCTAIFQLCAIFLTFWAFPFRFLFLFIYFVASIFVFFLGRGTCLVCVCDSLWWLLGVYWLFVVRERCILNQVFPNAIVSALLFVFKNIWKIKNFNEKQKYICLFFLQSAALESNTLFWMPGSESSTF